MRALRAVVVLAALVLAGCAATPPPAAETVTVTQAPVTVIQTVSVEPSSPPPPPEETPTNASTESAAYVEAPQESLPRVRFWKNFGEGGDAVPPFFNTSRPLVRFYFSGNGNDCGGQDNLIVHILNAEGHRELLWINEIGFYEGARYFILPSGRHGLEIQSGACGNWEAQVDQPGTSTSPPGNMTGFSSNSPDCFFLETGFYRFNFDHHGDSNFIVSLLRHSGTKQSLLVNEIGDYRGTVPVSVSLPATYCLDLQAAPHADWRITVAQDD